MMKTLLKILLLLIVVGGLAVATYVPAVSYWKERNRPDWRLSAVERGEIIAVVNATGEINPVQSVQVGAFVSGPIIDLPVKFNEEVEEGQLLAKIDPRLYQAAVARDQATLETRKAEVRRVMAQLEQAIRDHDRARQLQQRDDRFISQAEMDQLRYNEDGLAAQLEVALAAVDTARANLDNSLANVGYTNIVAPVAGIVIDRKIEPGQTLASSFQTPELFVVAPRMREKIHVYASVDEADIGLIRSAQTERQPVHFTVDAYPDDLFVGEIEEVRFSSQSTQNVVTYPVIVQTPNPDLKLLPGMTASISFQVDRREDALKVPNAALRFYPEKEHVRPEDHDVLEGFDEDDEQETAAKLSATETSEARRTRNRRHVWMLDGEKLRAIEVYTGISDSRFTEIVKGDLREGEQLVTGIKPKAR